MMTTIVALCSVNSNIALIVQHKLTSNLNLHGCSLHACDHESHLTSAACLLLHARSSDSGTQQMNPLSAITDATSFTQFCCPVTLHVVLAQPMLPES